MLSISPAVKIQNDDCRTYHYDHGYGLATLSGQSTLLAFIVRERDFIRMYSRAVNGTDWPRCGSGVSATAETLSKLFRDFTDQACHCLSAYTSATGRSARGEHNIDQTACHGDQMPATIEDITTRPVAHFVETHGYLAQRLNHRRRDVPTLVSRRSAMYSHCSRDPTDL